jgi:hypothetical protein
MHLHTVQYQRDFPDQVVSAVAPQQKPKFLFRWLDAVCLSQFPSAGDTPMLLAEHVRCNGVIAIFLLNPSLSVYKWQYKSDFKQPSK